MFTALIQLIKKHGAKLIVGIVPAVLAVLKPGNAFNTASAQSLLAAGGVLVAGLMYLGETLIKNIKEYGLSKTAIEKVFDEDGEWLRKNATPLRQAYTNAQKALDTIPGVPAALSELASKYDEVKGRGENIFSSLMAEINALKAHTPAIDDAAIEAHVLSFLDGFFKAKVSTPAPAVVINGGLTVTPANGAQATVAPAPAPEPTGPKHLFARPPATPERLTTGV